MGTKDYRNTAWLEFREKAFEKLGYSCQRCYRSDDDVVLQVHHKVYIDGRKPWEYNLSDCEVLCRGCHAREHGHIRPDYNWNLSHSNDLGSTIGTCELCGSTLRFEFHVFHNDWSEPMVLGTVCCDNLTGTQEATEFRKKEKAFLRYLDKWCDSENAESLFQANKRLTFRIIKLETGIFKVDVYNLGKKVHTGKKTFSSLLDAKFQLHSYIKNKEYKERFDRKN